MTTLISKRAAMAALTTLVLLAMGSYADADVKDYEFQLVQKDLKKGEAIVSVRLVHKPDGKPVTDAVIFAKRIDMAPDGMPTMTTTVDDLPSTEAGVYHFKADLMMAGAWQLSLGAKVQGETGTVESKLIFTAAP